MATRFLTGLTLWFNPVTGWPLWAATALANPRLHLVLRHNDKLVYELPAAAEPLDRIRRFFGSEVADQLIAEDLTDVDLRLERRAVL